jgi:hypothetical protein
MSTETQADAVQEGDVMAAVWMLAREEYPEIPCGSGEGAFWVVPAPSTCNRSPVDLPFNLNRSFKTNARWTTSLKGLKARDRVLAGSP